MMPAEGHRRLAGGIELTGAGGHARVWAPSAAQVSLVLERGAERTTLPLEREPDGFWSGVAADAGPGDRYWFALGEDRLRPDPYSRFQPEGPHGPSEIVDPASFRWNDAGWAGVQGDNHVIYEMHVGTFTREGTWRAAMAELPYLADLGITVIEMMPVNDFAGRFGWGYDGVNLFAPTRLYGTPDDLRAFIDRAHALGVAVILDVVYNHLGPDGNYLADFSPDYFTDKYKNDWGQAVNFEGPVPAREFFVENAVYWIDEFHFDGLRLDATQDMHDASTEHVIAAIARRTRAAAGRRRILLIAENEPQHTRLVRDPARGGFGLDAMWNDDFHHTAVALLTGRREAYYHDYKGSPQEFLSCVKYGFLYQGQYYAWQKKRRGTPALDLPRRTFVTFLENHDQVANTAFGRRLHQVAGPGRLRTMTALLLLGPGTPMLFQGQEFAASTPFLYFADHKPELHNPIMEGRREFMKQFASVQDPEVQARLPHPISEDTFRRSQLDLSERQRHAEAMALHRDLIHLRRTDPVIADGATPVDGAVLDGRSFLLRFFGGAAGDRLLLVNVGPDLDLLPLPEPLLAPPANQEWQVLWSSESVAYGGQGTPPLDPERQWHIPGEAAILLKSVPRSGDASS